MTPLYAALLTLGAVALYGALHSLLATRWAKAGARRALGPAADRLYRLAYNAIGALTLLPVLAVTARFPGLTIYIIPWPWIALTIMLQGVSLLIILLGLSQTGAGKFLGLRQLVKQEEESPPRLVVGGLYRWVRHPLYTAGLAFLWLSPAMTTSMLALFVGLSAYIYIGSRFEERRLVNKFGAAYRDYQRCIPRLIPLPWRRLPGC